MAETIKDVTFKLKTEEETAEGLADATKSVVTAAEDAGAKMDEVVSDKAARNFNSLNKEATAARGALALVGGEAGTMAGRAITMANALRSAAGGFGVISLSIVGIVGAIGTFVAALNWLKKEQEEHRKTIKDHTDAMDGYARELEKLALMTQGIVGQNLIMELAFQDLEAAKVLADAAEQEFNRLKKIFDETGKGLEATYQARLTFTDKMRTLRETESAVEVEQGRKDEEVRVRRIKQDEDAAKRDAEREKQKQDRILRERLAWLKRLQDTEDKYLLDKLQRGNEFDAELRKQQEAADLQAFLEGNEKDAALMQNEKDVAEFRMKLIRDTAEAQFKLEEENFNRRVRIEQNQIALEEKMADERRRIFEENEKRRQQMIKQSIALASNAAMTAVEMAGMFDLFGEASAKSEEEKAKAEAKRLAVVNAIKAATEIAEGVAAGARLDFFGMAQHFLAASLYTAAAIKAASGGGGGGGAGGAAGGTAERGRFRERDGPTTREEAEQEARGVVIINVYGHQIIGSENAGRQFDRDIESYRSHQFPGAESERF